MPIRSCSACCNVKIKSIKKKNIFGSSYFIYRVNCAGIVPRGRCGTDERISGCGDEKRLARDRHPQSPQW